jgi:D-glycero-D-manno-heptose 1,7-bisphosphate phosphatase
VTRRFVFLDRDGTLVRDKGYTHKLADYELLPGVREGLLRMSRAGFALAVVTNQSGIGRGYYGEADLQAFQAHLFADLERSGVRFERTLFCPHVPDAGCTCRKPAPGLLWRAREELGADLAASWVVGDRVCDVELAQRAGCRGAVLVGEDATRLGELGEIPAVRDLEEAAELILSHGPEKKGGGLA